LSIISRLSIEMQALRDLLKRQKGDPLFEIRIKRDAIRETVEATAYDSESSQTPLSRANMPMQTQDGSFLEDLFKELLLAAVRKQIADEGLNSADFSDHEIFETIQLSKEANDIYVQISYFGNIIKI